MTGTTLLVRLGGAPVLVRIEGNERLLRRFSDLYPDPPERGGKPQVLARWGPSSGEVRWRGGSSVRSRSLETVCAWAEWAAVSEAIRRLRREGVLFHASWAARGRSSLLVAGAHGSGKTTLAVALALRHRWRILADDLVVLDPRGGARAIERPVRIKPGTSRVLREVAPGMIALSRFGPGRPAPAPGAVLLLGRAGGKLQRSAVPPGLAVARLARLSCNFQDEPDRALRTLSRLTSSVPVHELRGGTIRERCAAALELAGR